MKRNQYAEKASPAFRAMVWILKALALVLGWGSVVFLSVFLCDNGGSNLLSWFSSPVNTIHDAQPAMRFLVSLSVWLFAAAILIVLILIALSLFGVLRKKDLMKPYLLSVAILLPGCFYFLMFVLLPVLVAAFYWLLGAFLSFF